ncbi:Arylsulfatase [Colletotrichum sp. SAR 10_86]|nr:Arylsulfatase [Colletotrichum sp. SAR 10_86]
MFIPSLRRAVAVSLTCAIFVTVLLTSHQLSWEQDIFGSSYLAGNESQHTPAAKSQERSSKFAYAQYATDLDYLCNAVINFNRLQKFGAENDMVLIFPSSWTEGKKAEAKAIRSIRSNHPRVILRPFDYVRISKTKASATWADSLNKFHAFDLTEYERVMIFDSDSQVLNNMDSFFQSPRASVAVPQAYWLNEPDVPAAERVLSSHVMLIEPNKTTHDRLIEESLSSGKLDMDLVNIMFKDTASILPHRRLALLTGEFRDDDHQKYLGQHDDSWDPVEEVSKSYLPSMRPKGKDLHMNSLDYVPFIKKHLVDQGTLYKRHFWKAAHNTNVTDIFPPYGGYPKFVAEGHNENYLPKFLQDVGYNTYYTGKLFNAHTVDNYHSPHAAGWTGSDFLLDPFTYSYLNATFQRNQDPPVSHEGEYSTDVLAGKALDFLDDAVAASKPFFLGIAPVAPHSNVQSNVIGNGSAHDPHGIVATPPIPAERHANLFPDAIVPRTDNFNPEKVSGASWVRQQPRQSAENVAFNDHFYRNRLRALQAVDELVDSVVSKLEEYGILQETYIFYTTDNGYHIGHHRLQPGKECGYEEDINIPLIIRGPQVPEGKVAEVVTTHQDLVPTIMGLAQAPLRADFDGLAIPLTEEDFGDAAKTRHEHVTVEYWGFAASEGPWGYFGRNESFVFNNTYKALRVVSKEYNLYYSVWCNNEHELYDLNVPFAHILGAHCIRKAMWTLCATHFRRDSTDSISNNKFESNTRVARWVIL